MFLEFTSTLAAAGLAGYTFFHQSGTVNDSLKIQRICANAGLYVKEGKSIKTIHLLRRTRHSWGTEYAYRIPLGLSFKDFKDKAHLLQDGLNNKNGVIDISLADIKKLKLDKTIIKQIQALFTKQKAQKEIELDYDGVLKIRVYKEPLTTMYAFTVNDFKSCKGWEVLVGLNQKATFKHDFEKRPHMIVAGATGFGKSEFIKLLIAILTHNQPEHVRFHLIDLKGGTELGRFKDMEQVLDFGRNPSEAKPILQAIQEDMDTKLDQLFETGAKDVNELGQKERHFIIIDEAADIADDKDCMAIVTDISRRGRAAGYRLVYATQYPTNETLPSQVRANIGARVCFRLETNAQSRAVLDEGGAEDLPEIEGRAIFRRVKNYVVQTPYIKRDLIEQTIKPHITIRARKDDESAKDSKETTTGRSDTLILEETRLS